MSGSGCSPLAGGENLQWPVEGGCWHEAEPGPNKPATHTLANTPSDLTAPLIIHDCLNGLCVLKAKTDKSANLLSTTPQNWDLEEKPAQLTLYPQGSPKVQILLSLLDMRTLGGSWSSVLGCPLGTLLGSGCGDYWGSAAPDPLWFSCDLEWKHAVGWTWCWWLGIIIAWPQLSQSEPRSGLRPWTCRFLSQSPFLLCWTAFYLYDSLWNCIHPPPRNIYWDTMT